MIDNVICMIIGLISGIIICIIIRELNKHKRKLKSMEECLKNYNLNIDILNNNVEHLMQELKEQHEDYEELKRKTHLLYDEVIAEKNLINGFIVKKYIIPTDNKEIFDSSLRIVRNKQIYNGMQKMVNHYRKLGLFICDEISEMLIKEYGNAINEEEYAINQGLVVTNPLMPEKIEKDFRKLRSYLDDNNQKMGM